MPAKNRRYCIPCDRLVGAREYVCKQCGADTDKWEADPDREEYERAQQSEEWERRGGGGL